MSDILIYKSLFEEVFEELWDISDSDKTNNCIGALASQTDFFVFKNNFKDRLIRLKNRFHDEPNNLNAIKQTVKEIATKTGYKWSGAYSELIALDYWQSFKDIDEIQYICKGPVESMPDSLAKQAGQKEVDVDFKIKVHFTTLYMDVKSFIPTHHELIDRIIDMVKNEIPEKKFILTVENLAGGDYLNIKKDIPNEFKSGNLKKLLVDAIKNEKRFLSYKALSGHEYQFRMSYPNVNGSIIHTSEDSFDSFLIANRNKYKALEYYNKLFINEGSILIFILNPWFNKEMIGDLGGSNQTFYRSFSRRVFIEFNNDTRDASEYFENISHSLTVKEISNRISGIIFIEDQSITEKNKNIYKSYIYLNPCSTNVKLTKNNFKILNRGLAGFTPNEIDDFSNDNY